MISDFLLYPLRLLSIVFVTFVDSLIAFLSSLIFPKFYRRFQHYRAWARRILFCAGIKIEITGLENIEKGKSYVFVANHSSYFDIPAVFVAIPQQMRIMYKKELEKIPLFGWYLWASDFIPVERQESSSARRSLSKAMRLVREDVSVLLFPEGTRSVDGKLQEFKRGAFILALKSGKELVPLTIIGSHKLLPKGKIYFTSGKINLIVEKPIDVRAFSTSNDLDSLVKIVWGKIYQNLRNFNT